MKDKLGKELAVGDKVVKASRYGSSVYLEVRYVERIDGGKVYLTRSDTWSDITQKPNTVPIARGDLVVKV